MEFSRTSLACQDLYDGLISLDFAGFFMSFNALHDRKGAAKEPLRLRGVPAGVPHKLE